MSYSVGTWEPSHVIYHDPCDDGFTAAWAAWKRWPKVNLIPAKYGQPLPPEVAGQDVLVVDFSYKRQQTLELATMARTVVVLDHHKTALEELEGFTDFRGSYEDVGDMFRQLGELPQSDKPRNLLCLLDLESSGAMITWNFCHPRVQAWPLVKTVQDRDLWHFKLPDTRPIHMVMQATPKNLESWDRLAYETLDCRKRAVVVEKGEAIQRYYDRLVSEMLETRHRYTLRDGENEHAVHAVCCPGMFASDVGHRLLELYPEDPFSVTFCTVGGGVKFSLRSEDSRADVSAIAARLGGGGHRNAAGFFVGEQK